MNEEEADRLPYPDTYLSVPVPEYVRLSWYSPSADAWRDGVRSSPDRLSQTRAAQADLLRLVSGRIRDEFPDPNSLAYLFSPYVGEGIARWLESAADRVERGGTL